MEVNINNRLKKILEKYELITEENKEYLDALSEKEPDFFRENMLENFEFSLENLDFLEIDNKSPEKVLFLFQRVINLFEQPDVVEGFYRVLNKYKIPYILFESTYLEHANNFCIPVASFLLQLRELEELLEELTKELNVKTMFPENDEDKRVFFEQRKEMLETLYRKLHEPELILKILEKYKIVVYSICAVLELQKVRIEKFVDTMKGVFDEEAIVDKILEEIKKKVREQL